MSQAMLAVERVEVMGVGLPELALPAIGYVLLALILAAVIAFATTPLVKMLCLSRWAPSTCPGITAAMHDHPIPRMGGLAIFFGFIVSVLLFLPHRTGRSRACCWVRSSSSFSALSTTFTPCHAKLKFVVQIRGRRWWRCARAT